MALRNHILPQVYLRPWSFEDQRIRVRDLAQSRSYISSLRNAAVEKGFYADDVEVLLNTEYENPALAGLQSAQQRLQVPPSEKARLAYYVSKMIRRVPKQRESIGQKFPEVSSGILDDVEDWLKATQRRIPEKDEIVKKRLDELSNLRKNIDAKLPEVIDDVDRRPIGEEEIELLCQMRWVFLTQDDEEFITGDAPVVFYSGIGIRYRNSEVTMPVGPDVALLATWEPVKDLSYRRAELRQVREINRRTVANATSKIFHRSDLSWVRSFRRDRTVEHRPLRIMV